MRKVFIYSLCYLSLWALGVRNRQADVKGPLTSTERLQSTTKGAASSVKTIAMEGERDLALSPEPIYVTLEETEILPGSEAYLAKVSASRAITSDTSAAEPGISVVNEKTSVTAAQSRFLGRKGALPSKDSYWNKTLPQDVNIKSYTLPNGFRIFVQPTPAEKPFISLRLLVCAGGAMETDAEDGLAHFIEHMTFNGTENFRPGTLLNYFRDNGMSFGGDTNAFTSLLHTCFQIDLPKTDEQSIADGLNVLKDQGTGCLFLQDEINREKGVILSEIRTRDTASYRVYKQFSSFLFPDSLLSKRFVLGTEKTVGQFKSEDFFSFYKKWYTPNRMLLVITGPVDPHKVYRLAESVFGKIKSIQQNLTEPDFGAIPQANGLQIKVIKEKELPQTTLSLYAQKQIQPLSSITTGRLRDFFTWELIKIILHQRMDILKDSTPISSFNIDHSFFSNGECGMVENCEIEMNCQSKDMLALIKELEQFHRYVSTFSFTQKETDLAMQVLEGRLKIACNSEKNLTPKELADMTVWRLMTDKTIVSSNQKLDYFQECAASITPEYCIQLWKQLWDSGEYLLVRGPLGEDVEEKTIRQAFENSRKNVLELNQSLENPELKSPFDVGRSKATIVDRSFNEKLGVECLRFSNNVRVTLKQTSFEKDQILIQVSLGNGRVGTKFPPYQGLDVFLSSAFASGGLQQCSCNELNRILDGKMVNIDFDVEDNCYAFKCLTYREFFKTQMELIGAYMLEPGYREEGVLNFRKILPAWYERFDSTAEGVLGYQGVRFLTCNDPRFGYPPKEVLEKRNFDEAQKILTPIFQHDYMEITVVGDFDRDVIVQQLRETMGKLSERDAQKVEVKGADQVAWPRAQTKQFCCHSSLDRAIVSVVWPVRNLRIPQEQWAFHVLCDILENRLVDRVRQISGDTYSPHVKGSIKETFRSHSSISSYLLVAPEKVDDITDCVLNIANSIGSQKITQEEVDRAIKPRISALERSRQQNGFWINWLYNLQSSPEKATWDLDNVERYQAVTIKDVQRLARRYLKRKAAICMQIKPQKNDIK